jgi:hypothetical protein
MNDFLTLENDIMLGKLPKGLPKPTPDFVLAGGSVRRWFLGEKEDSDFDYFIIGDHKIDEFILPEFKLIYKNKVNMTFNYHEFKVQIILLHYDSINDLLNSFDFCHCCFAYDGTNIHTTKNAIIAALRKHLRLNNVVPGYELDTLRRAFKYQRAGYSPCIGTIRDLALMCSKLEKPDIEKMIEMSPNGGHRNIIELD